MAYKITITVPHPDLKPGAGLAKSIEEALFPGGISGASHELSILVEELAEPKVGHTHPGKVVVYTDGGEVKTQYGSIGAYAAVIINESGQEKIIVESIQDTTNNRMELQAVIAALSDIEIGVPILIRLDSEYVMKGATQWGRKWRLNGWKTFNGGPVVNRDLWEPLLSLVDMHKVTFEHVKGHTGIPGNELVDSLCTKAMNDLVEELSKEKKAFGLAP